MSMKALKGNKCKYCHLMGHVIDKCPTIICKHCRNVGHPNWLCPGNPNAEKSIESPVSPGLRNKKNNIYGFESTNSLKGSGSLNRLNDQSMPRKSSYGDFKSEFKMKNPVERVEHVERVQEEKSKEEIKKEIINTKYYNKILNAKWGDLI
jgi:hypothetical protein